MTEIDPRATPFAPEELSVTILSTIQRAAGLQAIKRGANEVLKHVNKGRCTVVVLAADSEPLEIVLHLILVCEDKGCPYVFLPSKEAIGRACGVSVPVIAAAVIKHDALKDSCESILRSVEALV